MEAKLATEIGHFTQAAQAALALGCPVILNNFDLPVWRAMGNKEGTDISGRVYFVRRLNLALAELARTTPNRLVRLQVLLRHRLHPLPGPERGQHH